MKKILMLAALLSVLSGALLSAADTVEIYADPDPREFGRSPRRETVMSFPFREFAAVKTLAAGDPDGIPTAVLIDPLVVRALEKFLSGYRERRLGGAWFWLDRTAGRNVFHYYDDAAGLRFSFSAEKPGPAVLAVVDRFYRGDRKTGGLVRRAYEENFVVRIHSAENLIDPWTDRLTFPEALVAASLVGNADQPLWGIRDGRGMLRDLPARIEAKTALSLYQYRPVERNEEEFLAFIRRVRSREGGFARNLHLAAAGAFTADPNLDFRLPEEIVARGSARAADLVLLRYDILVRMGFQARVVSAGGEGANPPLLALFRDGERGNWGAVTDRDFFDDVAADWTRVPAVLAGAEVAWRELDPDATFRERKQVWKIRQP